MKKTVLWIGLAIGLFAVIILIGILGFHVISTQESDELALSIVPVTQINYNNYVCDNQVDFKGNLFAWQESNIFSSKVSLLNDSGEHSVLTGVTAPFQLLEDRVLFVKEGILYQRILSTRTDTLIAENVYSFIAMEHTVLYISEDTLFQYDLDDGKAKPLGENAYCFFIHHDQICIAENDGKIMRLESDGTWSLLCSFPITSYPFFIMSMGDYIVCEQTNALLLINTISGVTETVRVSEHNYATNRVAFICDNNRLFVSFQATKADGSIVFDVAHADNGVWSVDPETKEIRKLCDESFSQLYLFEGNLLFGVKNNYLYQIDIDTGRVTRISN